MSSARNAVQTLIIAIAMSGYVHSDEGGAVDINDLMQHPIAAFEYVENDADAVIIYRAPLVTNSRREKEQHVTLNELEKRFSVALAPEGIRRDWGDAHIAMVVIVRRAVKACGEGVATPVHRDFAAKSNWICLIVLDSKWAGEGVKVERLASSIKTGDWISPMDESKARIARIAQANGSDQYIGLLGPRILIISNSATQVRDTLSRLTGRAGQHTVLLPPKPAEFTDDMDTLVYSRGGGAVTALGAKYVLLLLGSSVKTVHAKFKIRDDATRKTFVRWLFGNLPESKRLLFTKEMVMKDTDDDSIAVTLKGGEDRASAYRSHYCRRICSK